MILNNSIELSTKRTIKEFQTTKHKKETTTYGTGNAGTSLEPAHRCESVILFNGIPTHTLLIHLLSSILCKRQFCLQIFWNPMGLILIVSSLVCFGPVKNHNLLLKFKKSFHTQTYLTCKSHGWSAFLHQVIEHRKTTIYDDENIGTVMLQT